MNKEDAASSSSPRLHLKAFDRRPCDGRILFADIATLLTVRGRRAENQDRAFAALIHRPGAPSAFVACVLDGMGGMESGGKAASLAATAFLEAMSQASTCSLLQQLESAIAAANAAVWRRLRGEGGTTLTAIAVDEDLQIVCAHVGDSRLYRQDDPITQATTDDTLAGLPGVR